MSDDLLVCVRVNAGPSQVPGSVQMLCSDCGADVWVAPSGRHALATLGLRLVCTSCVDVAALIERGQLPFVTRQQIDEMRAWRRRN